LTVEIELTDLPGGVVSREIVTIRDHGDGRYTVCLRGPSDEIEAATITPAPDHAGWVCVDPPVNVIQAINIALRVLRGETIRGTATAPLATLARAVLDLTGADAPKFGDAGRFRAAGGRR